MSSNSYPKKNFSFKKSSNTPPKQQYKKSGFSFGKPQFKDTFVDLESEESVTVNDTSDTDTELEDDSGTEDFFGDSATKLVLGSIEWCESIEDKVLSLEQRLEECLKEQKGSVQKQSL